MSCNAHHFLLALLSVQALGVGSLRIFERQAQDHPPTEHALVIAADPSLKKEMKVTLRSVIKNRETEFSIYVFALHEHAKDFKDFTNVDGTPVTVKYFSREDVDPYINKAWKAPKGSKKEHVPTEKPQLDRTEYSPSLDNPYNYVRYIMAAQLPKHKGIAWMDTDMIATVDIMKDMDKFLKSNKTIGAHPRMSNAFTKHAVDAIQKKTQLSIQKPPYFNAGFLYLSSTEYKDKIPQIQKLVALNNEHKWYVHFGSQPPLNLLFGGEKLFHITSFEHKDGLGHKPVKGLDKIKGVLHWNGEHKAWKSDGLNKEQWERYNEKSLFR